MEIVGVGDRLPDMTLPRLNVWSALHPEKFHPTIDWAWQKEQLAREREEEIAANTCGPDGCPLPKFKGT